MSEIIGLYVGLSFICQVVLYGMVWCELDKAGVDCKGIYTPSWFMKNTKMNAFGCWLLSIIITIITPFQLVWSALYWICHCGRRY